MAVLYGCRVVVLQCYPPPAPSSDSRRPPTQVHPNSPMCAKCPGVKRTETSVPGLLSHKNIFGCLKYSVCLDIKPVCGMAEEEDGGFAGHMFQSEID